MSRNRASGICTGFVYIERGNHSIDSGRDELYSAVDLACGQSPTVCGFYGQLEPLVINSLLVLISIF